MTSTNSNTPSSAPVNAPAVVTASATEPASSESTSNFISTAYYDSLGILSICDVLDSLDDNYISNSNCLLMKPYQPKSASEYLPFEPIEYASSAYSSDDETRETSQDYSLYVGRPIDLQQQNQQLNQLQTSQQLQSSASMEQSQLLQQQITIPPRLNSSNSIVKKEHKSSKQSHSSAVASPIVNHPSSSNGAGKIVKDANGFKVEECPVCGRNFKGPKASTHRQQHIRRLHPEDYIPKRGGKKRVVNPE